MKITSGPPALASITVLPCPAMGFYDYIPTDEHLPIFFEIYALKWELCWTLIKGLAPPQEAAFSQHLVNSLTSIIYGSNMIAGAGGSWQITSKLCYPIFHGFQVPDEIEENTPVFRDVQQDLMCQNLPSSTPHVVRSWREMVQHAKALEFLVHRLCIFKEGLDEEMLLHAHAILTYKLDTVTGTPWQMYSGVYRSCEASTPFHTFPSPARVPLKMSEMIHSLELEIRKSTKESRIDPIALTSKYMQKFIYIHPFVIDNDRMCRLFLDSMLLRLGIFPPCMGMDKADRAKYFEVADTDSALQLHNNEDKSKRYRNLASYVLLHVKQSMAELFRTVQ